MLQFRAWDFSRPLLVAPAMNTFMWDSPFTGAQLEVLQKLGAEIIPPVRSSPFGSAARATQQIQACPLCVVRRADCCC